MTPVEDFKRIAEEHAKRANMTDDQKKALERDIFDAFERWFPKPSKL